MSTHNRYSDSNLSLIDAVEALSEIADMELDRGLGITEEHDFTIQNEKISYKTIHWLNQKDATSSMHLVTDTFRVVLNYLRHFYKKDYGYVTDEHTAEGIKTIMVLVGEAAKKLDKYTSMFHQVHSKSVLELKEYKDLQEFYLSRIARTVDEGILGKWILALSRRTMTRKKPLVTQLVGQKPIQTKHVFVDLDSVKKDTEYELFFLRKEDGTRFFSPRLIRNIKLVCDFGDYFVDKEKMDDPFCDIIVWKDRAVQSAAKTCLKSIRPLIDKFYKEAIVYRQNELVEKLNKTILALMLSSNPNNQTKNQPKKCCSEYFTDFQKFLREALQCRDYQKLVVYPPKKTSHLAHCLLNITHGLCCALHTSLLGFHELTPNLHRLINDASGEDFPSHAKKTLNKVSTQLSKTHGAMSKMVKNHPNGPLMKVLDSLEKGNYQYFDPSWQQNATCQLYCINLNDSKLYAIHLPSPTYQEYINKAEINEEFKGFLRALGQNYQSMSKFLLFNLQDRTSWKDHSRCTALEELQKLPEFEKHIVVVTLNHDTEFYHQLSPYHEDNHTDVFIQNLKDHLSDESAGFHYPDSIQKKLFPDFISSLIDSVHRVFFGGKNVLIRERRMDFIQIVYLFLELKILEIVQPDCFSFTCKDGIDLGSLSNALMYSFLRFMQEGEFTHVDYDFLNTIIYAPSLLVRERILHPERFNRILNALKILENSIREIGPENFKKTIIENFGNLFKTSILQASVTAAKPAEIY